MSKERAPKVLPLTTAALGGLAVHYFIKDRGSQRRLAQSEAEKQAAKQRAADMEKLAMRDSLTGLYTRRGLQEAYEGLQKANEGLQKASSHDRASDAEPHSKASKHSLLLLDIDHFKEVNDTLGHDGGDQILCGIANVLKTRSRPRDVPSRLAGEDPEYAVRWGGEEMALLLPRASEKDAIEVAEEIRQLIEEQEDQVTQVTASFGVVELDLGLPLEDNVDLADKALYAAKRHGRNQVVSYSSLTEDIAA
jgi:diguanylate cyclase (GGDEF)-like protein